MIDERIVLKTNSEGYPILLRSDDHQIDVMISQNPTSGGIEVEISGDEGSLRRLGEILIGVSKSKGYHIHMDTCGDSSPLKIHPKNIRLTVSNSEVPPHSKQSSPPPKWAR